MSPKKPVQNFTDKQLEYILLAADGFQSEDIAKQMGVSKASVDILFSYMLKNYHFKTRTSLVAYCLRKKLIK